jgi:hypothetical protein
VNKPISLSHSARGKYDTCPRMYDLHYNEKIRPVGTTSALTFGSAIDKACENYMLERNPEHAKNIFKHDWNLVQEQDYTKIEYHPNDFDHELLVQSDNEYIVQDTVYTSASDLVKAGKEKERITYAHWISLYRKGLLLVDAFMNWVDENVEEILGTQIPIELEDEEGNKVPGLADFVIKVYGYDKPVLVDLKTAARFYDRNSVKESEQLGLYFFYLKQTKFPDMERAAYLVLNKQIKKNRKKTCLECGHVTMGREQTCAQGGKGKSRCNGDFSVDISPEVVIQYIHDEIPEGFIQDTINKFNVSVNKISAGAFEPCWESCDNYYGRKCPYYEFCRSGSMEGLIKKEGKVDV